MVFSLCSLLHSAVLAQTIKPGNKEKLALQYYEQGEYEKAADIWEELTEIQEGDFFIYDHLISVYLILQKYDKAVKLVQRKQKKFKSSYQFKIDEAFVYEKQNKLEEADKLYLKTIKNVRETEGDFLQLTAALSKRNKINYAIQVLEKGESLFPNSSEISNALIANYIENGNKEKGIERTLMMIGHDFYPSENGIAFLERNITDSIDFVILRKLLLKEIQKNPESFTLYEYLKWTFIQQKDWYSAFVQTKNLEKKTGEDGRRMMDLGEICLENEEWNIASMCFDYIVNSISNSGYKDQAFSGLLESKFKKIEIATFKDSGSILNLIVEYEKYIDKFGVDNFTVMPALRLAELYSNYIYNLQKAQQILEKFVDEPNLSDRNAALIKLKLGDILVMDDDVWSSELMYAQIEKDFVEDALGQEAKFRRARLSYFRGDFDWSIIQLDVLKGATTQLISNNAMRLALTIRENLGIDSNYDAMERFSFAELLVMQNKLEQAVIELDSIPKLFPAHVLSDDILFLKGQILEKKDSWLAAIETYNTLAIAFGTDVLADNALFKMGEIYMNRLGDHKKAKEAFEKIILNYPSSLYIIDARKHYRKLRGDSVGS